jgi:hypothetical protein
MDSTQLSLNLSYHHHSNGLVFPYALDPEFAAEIVLSELTSDLQ